MAWLSRLRLLFYSRFVFRVYDVACNHGARVLERKADRQKAARLAELSQRKADLQFVLQAIGSSHSRVCAECKGKCCGGPRERDTFIDRILEDPAAGSRAARRRVCHDRPHCPELTAVGCRLPYELRPMQCSTYYCAAAAREMTDAERRTAVRAVQGLMDIHLQVAAIAVRSRLRIVRRERQPDAG